MAVCAFNSHVTNNDATTNSCAKRQEDEACVISSGTYPKFSVGSCGCIICICDCMTTMFCNTITHRKIFPARKVARFEQNACREILWARSSETNGCYIRTVKASTLCQKVDRMTHANGSIIRTVLDMRRFSMKCHHLAVVINQCSFDIGTT